MANVAELIVKITADVMDAQKGIDSTASKASKMGAGIQKAALPAAAALAGIGAAAVGAANAAAEDAQAQAILANTMAKTTGASGKQIAAMEEYITKMSEASGVADDELRPAMGNLLRATGDTAKSQKAMAQALDISAATGKDVGTVSQALAKAYGGSTGSLKKLVPSLKDATLESGNMKKIMKEVADQTGGASAAAADTAAGKMKKMQNSFSEAQEELGTVLMPLLDKFAGVLTKVAGWISENTTLFYIVAGGIAAIAAAVLIANGVIAIYTAVTTIMAAITGTAWLVALGPIALVILAVLAVVAVIVILWKKSETFRTVILAVWDAIKSGTKAAADAIKNAFTGAFDWIKNKATALKNAVGNVWTAIKDGVSNAVARIKTTWTNALDAIKGFIENFKTAVSNVFTAIKEFVAERVQNIKTNFSNVWNSLVEIVSNVWGRIRGGVERGISVVVGLFRALPGKIKGVLSGAATMLTDIGRSIIEGLGAGVDAAKDWLMGKINAIADSIPGWLKKRLGIASPSKVTAEIGKQIVEGIAVGMDDGLGAVTAILDKTTKTIETALNKAFKSEKTTKNRIAEVSKAIKNETKDLRDNAVARDANTAALDIANKTLEDAQKQYDALADSVRGAALAYASVTNLGDEAVGADAMVDAMAARVEAVEQFGADLNALRAAGLAESLIQDMAAAGVEGAGAQAAAILAGGGDAIASFNALQARLEAAAAALGVSTADAMYKVGVDAAQAVVDGLILDQTALEAAATTFAEALAKAVRKALKKALRGGGKGGGGGDDSSTFLAPVVPISSAASASKAPGVPSSRAGTSSGYAVNVTVNGAIDPEATARQIRRVLRGHDRRVGLYS